MLKENVVIVNLKGGGRLGNQLFAFAAGYACALRNEGDLLFYDLLHLGVAGYPLADVVGSRFRIATPRELIRLGIYDYSTPLSTTLSTMSHLLLGWQASHSGHPRTLEQQPSEAFDLDERIVGVKTPVMISGYFQHEEYFAEYSDRIDAAIDLPSVEGVLTDDLPRPIVAVTFRRGDYLNLGWNLPLDYYHNALEYCSSKMEVGSLLLFSDDPEFVELVTPRVERYGPVFSAPSYTKDPLLQLAMMASCDHHVLANSTYCWWGAWLGERRSGAESVVVAPSGWVDGNENIIPDRWIVVPTGE
jgi:Glycosyl transferase family 11